MAEVLDSNNLQIDYLSILKLLYFSRDLEIKQPA